MPNPDSKSLTRRDFVRATAAGLIGLSNSRPRGKLQAGAADEPAAIRGLVMDPAHSQNVYTVTDDDQFYASTDNGAYWTTTSLPTSSPVTTLALNPKNTAMLLAGTQDAGAVHRQLQAAEGILGARHCRVHVLAVGDVGLDEERLGPKLLRGLLAHLLIEIEDGDFAAGLHHAFAGG